MTKTTTKVISEEKEINSKKTKNISFEEIVQADPTLKYLLRDSTFDYDKLEHQVKIRCAAINIAIMNWLNINY